MSMLCCIAEDFLGCGRKICGCVTCLLLFGPACIIVAIAMFIVAAKDPRGHHITTYNEAVDLWVGGQYAAFENLSLSFATYDEYGTQELMKNITSPDPIDDSGKSIRRYSEYLHYEYYGNVLHSPSSSGSDSVSVTNLVTGEKTTLNVNSFVTDWYSPSSLGCTHSCSSSNSGSSSGGSCYSASTCSTYCHNKNGYWDSIYDYCYLIKYAEEICVKVQDDGTFDSSDNRCYGEVYGSWQPDYEGSYYGNGEPRQIPSITVTVRSASDPYITLYKLTDGSLSFGLTSAQYAEIGIVFVVVGGFFCAFVAGIFVLVCFMGHCLCFGKGRTRF